MIVCVCHAVSERKLGSLVSAGCRTVGDLRRACGAGGDCAACVPDLMSILREADERLRDDPDPRLGEAVAAK